MDTTVYTNSLGDDRYDAMMAVAVNDPRCTCTEHEDEETGVWWIEDKDCPVHDLPYKSYEDGPICGDRSGNW